jgi:hypothetical protein
VRQLAASNFGADAKRPILLDPCNRFALIAGLAPAVQPPADFCYVCRQFPRSGIDRFLASSIIHSHTGSESRDHSRRCAPGSRPKSVSAGCEALPSRHNQSYQRTSHRVASETGPDAVQGCASTRTCVHSDPWSTEAIAPTTHVLPGDRNLCTSGIVLSFFSRGSA